MPKNIRWRDRLSLKKAAYKFLQRIDQLHLQSPLPLSFHFTVQVRWIALALAFPPIYRKEVSFRASAAFRVFAPFSSGPVPARNAGLISSACCARQGKVNKPR